MTPEYRKAIEWTGAYRKLVVTGSQRSGTTICARMLAHDLQWEFVDETAVRVGSIDMARRLIADRERFVLQMPQLLLRTSEVADCLGAGGLGVIVMRRPHREVEASRIRIGLKPRPKLMRFRQIFIRATLLGKPHFHVLDFDSLEGHPLHVDAALRRGFKAKQTQ